jgi:hypothetical protein
VRLHVEIQRVTQLLGRHRVARQVDMRHLAGACTPASVRPAVQATGAAGQMRGRVLQHFLDRHARPPGAASRRSRRRHIPAAAAQPSGHPRSTGARRDFAMPRRKAAASIAGPARRLHAQQAQRAVAAGDGEIRVQHRAGRARSPPTGSAARIFSVAPAQGRERAGPGIQRADLAVDERGRIARPVDAAVLARQFGGVGGAFGRLRHGGGVLGQRAQHQPRAEGGQLRRAIAGVVVSRVIGTAARSSIGPVSRPGVHAHDGDAGSASPARMAAWIGAAPRQRGSRLAWMFRQPRRGASSMACGRISP